MTLGERPKLLIFSHICGTDVVTGAEKLLLLFMKEMNVRFRCMLVVPEEGILADQARQAGIDTQSLDLPLGLAIYVSSPKVTEEVQALSRHPAWEALIFLLLREQPDYVYVNTSVHPMPAMGAKALGIPVLWSIMETMKDSPYRSQAAALVDAYSDRIIGISQSVLAPFGEQVRTGKARLLQPYVDSNAYTPTMWPTKRKTLRSQLGLSESHVVSGFVAATIYPNKGLLEFIHAMIPIARQHTEVHAVIVGMVVDETYGQLCRNAIATSGVADRFLWLDFINAMEDVYPAMDVVAVPSMAAEGFGMTALEGMVFGKPVVAFASGGLKEILEQTGNRAYLIPTGNVSGLSTCLNILLTNSSLRKAVGERNEKAALREFGLEAYRRGLEAFIQDLPPAASVKPAEHPVYSLPAQGLVRGDGPTVYWLEQGRKRAFPTPESLRKGGHRFEDVQQVPDYALDSVPDGPVMPALHSTRQRRHKPKRSRGRAGMRGTAKRSRHPSRRRIQRRAVSRIRRRAKLLTRRRR